MEFFESPVSVANNWKPELMSSVLATVNLEGWTTIRNAYDDGTYTRWVIKSPDTKFHVIFFTLTAYLNVASSRTDNGPHLYVTIAETYDTSTEEFNGVAPVRNNYFVADSVTETYNNSFTIASLVSAGNSGPGFVPCGVYISGSTFNASYSLSYYGILVDSNTISFALDLSTSRNHFLYIGNIDSAVVNASVNDPNTAVIAMFGEGGSMVGGGTVNTIGSVRSPMNGGKVAHIWVHTMDNASRATTTKVSSVGWDQWQGSVGPTVTKISIFRIDGSTNATFGNYRGELKQVIRGADDGTYGDLLTIGTETYFCCKVSSNAYWIRSA